MKASLSGLRNMEYTLSQRIILDILSRDGERTRENFPLENGSFRTSDSLASVTGVHLDTVYRALKRLEEAGEVHRDAEFDDDFGFKRRVVAGENNTKDWLWIPDKIQLGMTKRIVLSVIIRLQIIFYKGSSTYFRELKSSEIERRFGIKPKTW